MSGSSHEGGGGCSLPLCHCIPAHLVARRCARHRELHVYRVERATVLCSVNGTETGLPGLGSILTQRHRQGTLPERRRRVRKGGRHRSGGDAHLHQNQICRALSPSHVCRNNQACGNKWQDSNQHYHNTIPSPKPQKKIDPHGQPDNGTAKVHGSKNCGSNTLCCSDKGVVFTKGGGGGLTSQSVLLTMRV